MNGNDPAGVESANPSSEGNPLSGLRDALTLFQRAAKEACDLGEYKLQREAEDASARLVGQIEAVQADWAARERLRSSEALHGVDQEEAKVA